MRTQEHAYDLLHVKEAAAELGVHPATLRRHIHDGDLQAVRLGRGGRYRVSRQALEAFLRPCGHGVPSGEAAAVSEGDGDRRQVPQGDMQ